MLAVMKNLAKKSSFTLRGGKESMADFRVEKEQPGEEYFYEHPEEWDDGSSIGCKDCPPDECTGHCMSCAYRPI